MGRRASKKRSDRRWIDDDGIVWASRFEYEVYVALSGDPGVVVQRCEKGGDHTFVYTTPVRSAKCLGCGDSRVVQVRTYTPDILVTPAGNGGDGHSYYLEVKGHLPQSKRALLRGFLKTGPDIDLRFILYSDRAATRSLMMSEYIPKYFKRPFHVWDGRLPKPWYRGEN